MARLCVVARGEVMLYGYLLVALERELEDPDGMELTFDRRRPGPAPGAAPLGLERRTRPQVDEILRTQGYVILDENGNVAAPEIRPASGETVPLWKSAAEWWRERPASAWRPRRAIGNVVKFAGIVGVLAISAVLGATPTQTAFVASPPTVASPPAPVIELPRPRSVVLASAPAPAVLAPAPADRPPAPARPLVRRPPVEAPPKVMAPPPARSGAAAPRPAPASVTTPPRKSGSPTARPTAVLAVDPKGMGTGRSITYTASVSDASGQPLTDAEVSLLAWMPDGSDLIAPLRSTDTPGTYRGTVEVGVLTPGNLRIRIAHGAKHVDITPRRRQS
jgi:hypothetical protein